MKRLLFVMVLAVCAVVLVSCGKDDYIAPDVDLKSYIIGTWHSYKITAYANGQYKSADITKINEYSAAYMEMRHVEVDNREWGLFHRGKHRPCTRERCGRRCRRAVF